MKEHREWNPRNFILTVAAIVLLPPLVYFASIVPAFKITTNTEGIISTKGVRKMYRPLFDYAPRVTRWYLDRCGISEIETYLVIQPSQGESS
jgi:hypothetical protein